MGLVDASVAEVIRSGSNPRLPIVKDITIVKEWKEETVAMKKGGGEPQSIISS